MILPLTIYEEVSSPCNLPLNFQNSSKGTFSWLVFAFPRLLWFQYSVLHHIHFASSYFSLIEMVKNLLSLDQSGGKAGAKLLSWNLLVGILMLPYQGSISPMFYKQLLQTQIPNEQKYTDGLTVLVHFWDLLS